MFYLYATQECECRWLSREEIPQLVMDLVTTYPDDQEAQAREMLLSLATAEEAQRRYVQPFDASRFEM
jgi:hypothetical protein